MGSVQGKIRTVSVVRPGKKGSLLWETSSSSSWGEGEGDSEGGYAQRGWVCDCAVERGWVCDCAQRGWVCDCAVERVCM